MSTSYKKRKKARQRPNSITSKEWKQRQKEIKTFKGQSMGEELF